MGLSEILLRAALAWMAVTIAKSKGRDPVFWGVLTGIFYFPLVILYFLLPLRRGEANTSRQNSKEDVFDGHTVEVKPMSKEEEHQTSGTKSFSSAQWYLLDKERRSAGPFAFMDMQQKFWDGDLTEETFVWIPEWKEWKKISSIPGLLSALSR